MSYATHLLSDLTHWVIISNTSGETVSSIVAYSFKEPVLQFWNI